MTSIGAAARKQGISFMPGTTLYPSFVILLKRPGISVQRQSNDGTGSGTEIVSMATLKCHTKD